MLSRHAEGLFWMGRYMERTSDVTRMLDVAYEAQLERVPAARAQVWKDLLRVLYLDSEFNHHYDAATTENINRFLILDADNPASVAHAIHQARANIMNVRDVVPIELLETVNRMHTLLVSGRLERELLTNPHSGYKELTDHARAISGAVADAMARTDGYRFLILGRFLERGEMTCRMIEVNRAVSPTDAAAWHGALRSLSGLHAFTQLHGPLAPVDTIVEFLLLDTAFPYSVLYCLSECAAQLSVVAATGNWESVRALGRAKSDLEYTRIPTISDPALESLLKRLEDGIRQITGAFHGDLYQFGGDPAIYSFEAL